MYSFLVSDRNTFLFCLRKISMRRYLDTLDLKLEHIKEDFSAHLEGTESSFTIVSRLIRIFFTNSYSISILVFLFLILLLNIKNDE